MNNEKTTKTGQEWTGVGRFVDKTFRRRISRRFVDKTFRRRISGRFVDSIINV